MLQTRMDDMLALCRIGLVYVTLLGSTSLQMLPSVDAGPTASLSIGMPPGIDIAIEQPVTASSAMDTNPASKAVDGDPAIDWCPSRADSAAQLTVSFDQPYQLTGSAATWFRRAPIHNEVRISADGR